MTVSKLQIITRLRDGVFGLFMMLFSVNAIALHTVTPTDLSLNFGNVEVGSQSDIITVTLTNDNDDALISRSFIGFTDADNVNFEKTITNCPAQIEPHSSCSIEFSFQPTAPGSHTAMLTLAVVDGDSEVDYDITLSGTSIVPESQLDFDSEGVNFGSVALDTTSSEVPVILTNTGNTTLSITDITADSPFSQTHNCPTSLSVNGSCIIRVSVTPDTIGQVTGNLTVTATGHQGSFTQSLSLAATAEDNVALIVSPTTLSFPATTVGMVSDAQTLTITNQGESAISINSVVIEGDFEHTNECGASIGVGESCSINVVFLPQTEGEATGSLMLDTSSGLISVTLSGMTAATNLLSSYTGGDPNVESTSEVISNTCSSDSISDRMQEDCDAVVEAAIQGDQNTASALRQITPEIATKANFTIRRGGERQVRNLGSRISALRAGVRGLSFQDLDWRIDDQSLSVALLMDAYEYGRQSGAGASADNALLTSKLGVFVTGSIGTGKKNETDKESGFDFDTYGLTIGADYRITQQFVLGSALGYIDAQTELDNNAGDLDTQGYSLSFYGTYYHAQNYFLDFAATYGSNNFDQKRRIDYQLNGLADVSQDLSADYDGDLYSLFVGSGYEFNRGEWAFGPRFDLEYLRSNVDEFTEEASYPNEDGGGWATRVSDTKQTWLTFNFGGKVTYTYSAPWGVMLPYARLDWLHEFKDDAQTNTAYFVDDLNGNAIEITTDDPDRDYMRLRIGTSMQFKNGIAGFIDYDTLLANSQWSHHNISLGMRMVF
jgi:outer membrane autotransporter protein